MAYLENIIIEDLLFENFMRFVPGPLPGSVLVVSCGTGAVVKRLSDEGLEAMGIDHNFSKIQEAVQLYPPLDFFQHDLENVFYINYFDRLWILNPLDVFHGTSSQKTYILKNALSCLKESGIAILFFSQKTGFDAFNDWIEREGKNTLDHTFGLSYSEEPSVNCFFISIKKI